MYSKRETSSTKAEQKPSDNMTEKEQLGTFEKVVSIYWCKLELSAGNWGVIHW